MQCHESEQNKGVLKSEIAMFEPNCWGILNTFWVFTELSPMTLQTKTSALGVLTWFWCKAKEIFWF